MREQNENLINICIPQRDRYDSEFERESYSVQSLNFDKVHKNDNP